MCKMTKFILNNFNLTSEELKHVPVIVAEIKEEVERGEHDDVMNECYNQISEYQLYDIFDEKLLKHIDM